MKKKLFSLQVLYALVVSMMMLLSTGNITAQTSGDVEIGSGTGSTGAGSATSPITQSYKNFRYQVIYTKAEIEAAGGVAGNVTKLGFKVQAGATQLTNYTVRMANTTKSSMGAHVSETMTQVYTTSSYSATSTGSFNMITFSTPFNWNGTSNILVDICYSRTSTSSSGGSVYNFTTSDKGTRYVGNTTAVSLCSTSTNYHGFNHKPQIRFVMQKAAVVTCNEPTSLAASAITSTSATISWTAASPAPTNGYEWSRTTTNVAPTGTGIAVSGTNVAQSGLTAGTSYYFWIRSKCNATTYSDWTSISFSTTCIAPTLTTTAGTRCGAGSVNLSAAASAGTVYWWDAATGGNFLGTGTSFNTPIIASTTTFYASAGQTLTGNNMAQLGSGSKTSTIASQSPFHSATIYKGQSSNYLIKASELLASGISAGYITSLGLDVVTAGGTLNTFYIKVGATTAQDLSSGYETPNTYYYGSNINGTTYTPIVGLNSFALSGSGFYWDGTSNVSILIYWQNTTTTGATSVKYDDGMSFEASRSQSLMSTWGTSSSTNQRPKFVINGKGLCMSNRVAAIATVTEGTNMYYQDLDGDGYGNEIVSTVGCTQPAGYVTNNTDCDDADDSIWRTASFLIDADGDGYHGGETGLICYGLETPAGLILESESLGYDCDDSNNTVWRMGSFYVDADGDEFSVGEQQEVCYGNETPAGYALNSLGEDCDDTNAAINPNATEICYNNIDDNCDGELSEGCAPIIVNMLTANNTMLPSVAHGVAAMPYSYPGVKTYKFSITNNLTGVTEEVLSTTRFTSIPGNMRNYNASYDIKAAAVINGEEVPYAGNTITVFTPGIQLVKLTTCGVTVDRLGATISSTVGLNAISYTFRARLSTDNGSNPTYYSTIPSASRFTTMNSFVGLTPQYDASYVISVRYSYTDEVIDTVVESAYGDECSVKMPNIPTVGLASPTCGTTLTRIGQTISAYPAPHAISYEFRIRLTSDNGTSPTYYYTTANASRFTGMSSFNGLTLTQDTSYTVSVRYKLMMSEGEIWANYGAECALTTPGSQAVATRTVQTPFAAVAYPNPFADSFLLDVKTSYNSPLDIKVYDMLGRLVEQKQANVNELEITTIGNNYPAGVYNVIVTQDDKTKAVRVVKR